MESQDSPETNAKRPVRWRRWLLGSALAVFAFFNVIAIFQVRGMCNYEAPTTKSTRLAGMDDWGRARVLLCGPTVRRQLNTRTPQDFGMRFESEYFTGAHGIRLEAWKIPGDTKKPMILMLPGYGGSKDTLLRAASEFHSLGHELCMLDFHGNGGSAGTTTTVGFDEAEDVAAAVAQFNGRPYMIYGTSMGAAAALRAVHVGKAQPERMILEAPFDTFSNTINHRFDALAVPRAPFAPLLVFWSGTLNGFNAFAHNPVDYSRSVRCPTLLMQGAQDEMVGVDVPAKFERALGAQGEVVVIPNARHAFLFQSQPELWRKHVRGFLRGTARDRARM